MSPCLSKCVPRDPNSVANILSFVTKHIKLNWNINFAASKITGSAVLSLERVAGGQDKTVKLDCSNIFVKRVLDAGNGKELVWKVDNKATKFGGMLSIDLVNTEHKHDIEYCHSCVYVY